MRILLVKLPGPDENEASQLFGRLNLLAACTWRPRPIAPRPPCAPPVIEFELTAEAFRKLFSQPNIGWLVSI